jgi:sugar lactone lactonase YvrE
VDASTGIITTFAGNGNNGFSGDGGLATNAAIGTPEGVAVDGIGNFFLVDRNIFRVRRVDAATGIITTAAAVEFPTGVTVDCSGNLYVAEYRNHRIRKIDGVTGVVTTVAGNGTGGFSGDGGPATQASLNLPQGVTVDGAGNLLIADTQNSRLRRVDALTGIITTVAGTGMFDFSGDSGPADTASLNLPYGVAADGFGDPFIADSNNHRIRRVGP